MTKPWQLIIWIFAPILALADSTPVRVEASLSEQHQAVYPRPAFRDNREGWVLVDFDIDANGSVRDVRAIDSLGGNEFELPAVNSVARWHYAPAQMNGNAVSQSGNLAYVVFAINTQSRGSTKRFADRYNDALNLIQKQELQRANSIASSVFDDWPMNLHELAKLWSLRAQLALLQGDVLAAQIALQRAMANDGEWLAKPTYESMLLASVQIETEIGQFGAAIDSYQTLVALNPRSSDALQQTKALIESLHATIASDKTLATDGKVSQRSNCEACEFSWSFVPVRNKFKIADVVGALSSVNMICDSARVATEFTSDTEWQVPPQLSSCRVELQGDSETTFRIHQQPD